MEAKIELVSIAILLHCPGCLHDVPEIRVEEISLAELVMMYDQCQQELNTLKNGS